MIKLAIIVPCYNEEEVLSETNIQLSKLIKSLISKGKINADSKIYYIDDGSTDHTWEIIEDLSEKETYIEGIKLSRNVGHQHALMAGLMTAAGDALISIDADLQDDVSIIEQMIDDFNERKVQIVYGVRKQRTSDSYFKRTSADLFYKVLRLMGGQIVGHHADFRLMGRPAIEGLREFREVNLFLRGIIPLIGYKSSIVYFNRAARYAGTSKYPFKKMLALALDGITSFSIAPLRMITVFGFLVFLISALMGLWVLISSLMSNALVPGWASTILPIYFLGGVQVLCIGILGEYIGKIYNETKQRPRYFIEKMTE